MEIAGDLNCAWKVVVVFSDLDNPDTTFSLEPIVKTDEASLLPKLQADAILIARSLENLMTKHGRNLQLGTAKVFNSNG